MKHCKIGKADSRYYTKVAVTDKLLDAIKLVMQYEKSSLEHDPYKSYVHVDSSKLSVRIMKATKGCLTSHRFHAAAQLLEILSLERSNTDHFLWKAGCQVLENHKNSSDDLVNYFLQHIRSLKQVNKQEIALEFLIYLLKKKKFNLVYSSIDHIRQQRTFRKNLIIDPLLKMYLGIVDYAEWAKQLICKEQTDPIESNQQYDLDMMALANRAISTFMESISYPGQWDIVIPKLLHMLQYYNRMDEAEGALLKYVEANSFHLNSHIYLYEFYKTYDHSKEKQKKCLNELVNMCPSDPRVLELIELLQDDSNEREKSLHLLFNYLDYNMNKDSIHAWSLLAKLLIYIKQSSSAREMSVVSSLWEYRVSYWLSYHFDPNEISIQTRQNGKLAIKKVTVLCLLEKADINHPYIAAVHTAVALLSSKLTSKLLKAVAKVDELFTN